MEAVTQDSVTLYNKEMDRKYIDPNSQRIVNLPLIANSTTNDGLVLAVLIDGIENIFDRSNRCWLRDDLVIQLSNMISNGFTIWLRIKHFDTEIWLNESKIPDWLKDTVTIINHYDDIKKLPKRLDSYCIGKDVIPPNICGPTYHPETIFGPSDLGLTLDQLPSLLQADLLLYRGPVAGILGSGSNTINILVTGGDIQVIDCRSQIPIGAVLFLSDDIEWGAIQRILISIPQILVSKHGFVPKYSWAYIVVTSGSTVQHIPEEVAQFHWTPRS
jgi:hypothetical protein